MKKRFIAGAVCPKCGASDSVRLHILDAGEQGPQTRDCVDCGYEESLNQQVTPRHELPNRVNGEMVSANSTKGNQDNDVQPLTIH